VIALDRHSPTPIGDQLAEQLRFALGTGQYRPGERLPSTRQLADEVGVSFHTVRKAYQTLEREGLLVARGGSGYTVAERAAEPLADRMERGASVAQQAVHRLAALGLTEEQMEYVLQEQLTAFEPGGTRPKVLFAAPYRDLAEAGAEQVAAALQTRTEGVTLDQLSQHPETDLVVVPFAAYQAAMQALPQAEVVGVHVYPCAEALAEVARLGPSQTLGLVTRYPDGVGPTLRELRALAGFTGPALALPADAERERLAELLEQVDLLVYTAQARRRLRPLLPDRRGVLLTPVLERTALEAASAALRR
jgi:GntR family transcriptional regulator